MIQLKPNLSISRLAVYRQGRAVYDQRFHLGVNIIRGENSKGKSTITDFLFFALGGEYTNWKEHARLCDAVVAEVLLNGVPITTKREIDKAGKRPMFIFWGPFEQAAQSSSEKWEVYPYSIHSDRDSFSQVLFRALGMPELRGSAGSNITMHQILRLMYVDQTSPMENIFRADSFDNHLTRQTVGDFLCGAYDPQLYEDELARREKDKEFSEVAGRLKNIFYVFSDLKEGISAEAVQRQIDELEKERRGIYERIDDFKKSTVQQKILDADKSQRRMVALEELSALNIQTAEADERAQALEFEIEDARIFLEVLQSKLDSISDAHLTIKTLGGVVFEYCPACFTPLPDSAHEGACRLCKSTLEGGVADARLLRMRQELEFQIRESSELQVDRLEQRQKLGREIVELQARKSALVERVGHLTRAFTWEVDQELQALYERIGYLDRSIEGLHERLKLSGVVSELSEKRETLNAELARLTSRIEIAKMEQERQRDEAYRRVEDLTVDFLRRDTREKAFQEARRVRFSFAQDRVYVDDKTNFSASSLIILRNSFHFALFWASCKDHRFRYPRFIMYENIEDKGMEDVRSHDFQRFIVSVSSGLDIAHQIIFCTSKIAPELNNDTYCIGEYYQGDNRTLKL